MNIRASNIRLFQTTSSLSTAPLEISDGSVVSPGLGRLWARVFGCGCAPGLWSRRAASAAAARSRSACRAAASSSILRLDSVSSSLTSDMLGWGLSTLGCRVLTSRCQSCSTPLQGLAEWIACQDCFRAARVVAQVDIQPMKCFRGLGEHSLGPLRSSSGNRCHAWARFTCTNDAGGLRLSAGGIESVPRML